MVTSKPLTRAEISARWRQNNPERHRELYTKYYNEQRDSKLEKQRVWRKANPEYRGGNRLGYMNSKSGWARYKTNSIKTGAKRRKIEFAITYEDVEKLMVTHCPVLGIELNYNLLTNKSKVLSNSPSLDRINNDKGYLPGNIIIVSQLVNRVKTSLTLQEIPEVMGKIITFYDKYRTEK